MHGCSSPDPMEGTSKTLTVRVNAGSVPTVNNVHIPIIRLARIPVAPDGTPLISAEEVVVQEDEDSSSLLTYSAQSKSLICRGGNYKIMQTFLWKSVEKIYLSGTIFACPGQIGKG